MKVQVEDVSPVEKRLSIEVEPQVVEKELAQAYAQLARQVKMPGFRPGKVPRRLLEQHYRAEVEADVARRVQVRAYIDAVREHGVPAIGDPQFIGGTIEADRPFSYTARVEVKPTLTPRDYRGLTLSRPDPTVDEARVDEQLERVRTGRTTLEPVTDRQEVHHGDMAVIDFDATIDGQPFAGNTGREVTVEVTAGELVEGNLPQLAGARVGGVVEFDYTFPAEYRVAEVKGKTAHFSATVRSLKAKKVPALDDELARSMGHADLAAFRAKVREDLERARRREARVQEREEIFERLAERNPVEVPQALVDRGIDVMLESALGSMSQSGMDLRRLNLDWARLREELRPRSLSEVRGQLILEAIARVEGITATDEDVEAQLALLAEEAGVPVAKVRTQYAEPEARDTLRARIVDDKVIDFLKAHAAPGTAPASSPD